MCRSRQSRIDGASARDRACLPNRPDAGNFAAVRVAASFGKHTVDDAEHCPCDFVDCRDVLALF